jgi:hypothetical protein
VKSDDPWKDIEASPDSLGLIGHLVLESRPHEVFRALDALGRRILFLVHDPASISSTSLPRMAGLELVAEVRKDDGKAMLSVRLENQDDADIFARFCDDIVMTVKGAANETTAVQAFIGRTWKWHALLKGARKKTLSRQDQLGLIGELYTMREDIGSIRGIGAALEAWRGSEGAPKDFELSGLCIECKARGASSRSKVRITSEHQLADVPGQELVLLVHTFATAEEDEVGAIDLHSIVSLIRSKMDTERPDLRQMLEEKLDEAGYENEHEYDVVTMHRSTESYSVVEGFPRIVPGNYHEGPIEVSYDLPLARIAPFEISKHELLQLLETSE